MKTYFEALETHSEALDVHSGVLEVPPGAIEAHPTVPGGKADVQQVSIWSNYV
jgi:hypothetical protein